MTHPTTGTDARSDVRIPRAPLAPLVALAAVAALSACSSDSADTAAFSVAIVEPADGATVTGPTPVVVAVAPDSESLTVFVGNTAELVAHEAGRYTFDWAPEGGAGATRIRVRVSDDATGQEATGEIVVEYVPDYAPRMTVCETLCRLASEVVDGVGTVTVAVEVPRNLRDDDATVTWTVDGVTIASEAAYPFRAAIDTTALTDGDHALAFVFAPAIGTGGTGEATLRVANCDGDGDGFDRTACGGDDCDDRDVAVNPDATEVCDGVSQDCDDERDEGATCPNAGDVCLAGACRPSVCGAQGDECVAASQARWPFDCDLDTATCRQRCALDHPIPERACPPAHSCRPAAGLPDGEGWCVVPGCTGEPESDCTDGQVCVPFDFGYGECAPDGDGLEGDACTIATRLDPVLVDACAAGTECFAGECTATCDPTTTECGSGLACVRIWDSVRAVAEGACMRPCDAFGVAGCLDGSACQPVADFAFAQSPSWACLPALDGPVPEGEACTRGVDVCAGGTHCVDIAGAAGTDPRCVQACDLATPGEHCAEGDRCAPTPGGLRGTCIEECAPFPRQGTGGYGCDSATATCHPTLGGGGACVEDVSVLAVGDACGPARTFGACPDDGYCVDLAIGGDSPVCRQLCRPFAEESGCGEGEVCNPRPLLDGHGAVGACDPEPNEGAIGEACAVPGRACAEDATLCVDTGDGPTCRRACAGPVDCGEDRCLWTAPLDGLVVRGQAGVCEL